MIIKMHKAAYIFLILIYMFVYFSYSHIFIQTATLCQAIVNYCLLECLVKENKLYRYNILAINIY